uniref:Uncharacterized protein n=1 Tax=Meloidogyne enterolobii TaxID=390850 RepID=A0A6V7THZ4_MELEN|nr:unnamed protein product [Meloidogyne enterolobii]
MPYFPSFSCFCCRKLLNTFKEMVIQKWQNGKIMGGRDKGRSKKSRRWSCTCKKFYIKII